MIMIIENGWMDDGHDDDDGGVKEKNSSRTTALQSSKSDKTGAQMSLGSLNLSLHKGST